MLVRFLSFIASVIGTDRYKPIIISCFALLFASSGVLGVMLFHQPTAKSATSRISQAQHESTRIQRQSSQLGDIRQQLPEDTKIQPSTPEQAPPTSGQSAPTEVKPTNPEAIPTPIPTDIILSTTTVSLSLGSTSNYIIASASDTTRLEWSVQNEDSEGRVQPIIDNPREASVSMRLRFRADSNAPAGTYVFMITAKDNTKSTSINKTITVTVNP